PSGSWICGRRDEWNPLMSDVAHLLRAAGLAQPEVNAWLAGMQTATSDYGNDSARYSKFWIRSNDLLGRLPAKPSRNAAEAKAAQVILSAGREHRERFLTAYAETLYDVLTNRRTRFVRIEDLVIAAAASIPGLTPTALQVADESELPQRDKDGI